MQNDLVEAVARGLCRRVHSHGDAKAVVDAAVNHYWHEFVDEARAVIPIVAEHFAGVADNLAEDAWNEANRQGQNAACASGRNYGCRSVAAAIRAAGSATP